MSKYDKELVSKVLEMWNSGLNKGQIARELGITHEQAKTILRKSDYIRRDNKGIEKYLPKVKNELLSYGYEYISGYERYNSIIRIKDLASGIEYNVNCHNFIQRKRNNKANEHYEPERDKKITLRGLYKLHRGICYICGEKCDFSDWWINENGTRCFGGNYPSIEHLVPRYLQGKTEWGNVMLAHRKCNSKKHTKTIDESNIEIKV